MWFFYLILLANLFYLRWVTLNIFMVDLNFFLGWPLIFLWVTILWGNIRTMLASLNQLEENNLRIEGAWIFTSPPHNYSAAKQVCTHDQYLPFFSPPSRSTSYYVLLHVVSCRVQSALLCVIYLFIYCGCVDSVDCYMHHMMWEKFRVVLIVPTQAKVSSLHYSQETAHHIGWLSVNQIYIIICFILCVCDMPP